jgi:predicted transcriptional regulator
LELEDILSPNRINYLVDGQTLIEEHIAGIPGDQFIKDYLHRPSTNQVRIAKEFVKFNERCFVRLLGDMRAYNYVVDITPDFEDEQYRIRAIDFDQQSYEDRRSLYFPQFYKDNLEMVKVAMEHMTPKTVTQYQHEERSLIVKRLKADRYKIKDLLDVMRKENISSEEKIETLKQQLDKHYGHTYFSKCKTMGDIIRINLNLTLNKLKTGK